jgi:hypothetical protein
MRLNLLVKYPTHAVNIHCDSDDDRICCFKYNRSRCDIELYSWSDLEAISDYIREPLPTIVYSINFDEDSEGSE